MGPISPRMNRLPFDVAIALSVSSMFDLIILRTSTPIVVLSVRLKI